MSVWAPETEAILEYVRFVLADGSENVAFDGLRVLDHPSRLAGFLAGHGAEVVPVTVELWPSLSCDARCPTCPYRLSGARELADASHELQLLGAGHSREILHALAAAGVRSVIFTGGGEPLLHPRIVDIVGYAARRGLAWALFTNGLSLDARMAESLLTLSPRFLRVSLDAGSAEQYARTYGLNPSAFDTVLSNVRHAALIAKRMGSRHFGLGFTLEPNTPDKEFAAIRDLLRSLLGRVGSGLGLVAFRPRVIHYRAGKPLCPQPRASMFPGLADRIRDEIIRPLTPIAQASGTRLDLKKGLFLSASVGEVSGSCLSSSWMTNLDHDGYGYVTAELAGAPWAGQRWGRVVRRDDFLEAWMAPTRLTLYEKLATGEISVPPFHRTSPVDAALHGIYDATGGPVEPALAAEILEALHGAGLTSLTNTDFI